MTVADPSAASVSQGEADRSAGTLTLERAAMEIDLDAIAANLETVRAAIEPGTNVMAVLKGDGYGLGAAVVAELLQGLGVEAFATDNAAEAVALREAGIGGEIVVFYGEPGASAGVYVERELTPTVYDLRGVFACVDACEELAAELTVWLGANVGFNRAGPRGEEEFAAVVEALRSAPRLRVAGVLAHLTSSNACSNSNQEEINAFQRRRDLARDRLGNQLQASLFASHGLLRWGCSRPTDWVRPGLALTGEHCFDAEVVRSENPAAAAVKRLRPALTIRGRVIHLTDLPAGEGVGYAPRDEVETRRRLATVALGFRSGLPDDGTAAPGIHRGKKILRIGPLGMDSLQVDVTESGQVSVGDWVTIIGAEGDSRVSLADVCSVAGVTPYQFLARLRIPHRYRKSGSANMGGSFR